MNDSRKDPPNLSRRRFIAGTGSALFLSALPLPVSSGARDPDPEKKKFLSRVPPAPRIVHQPDLCTGCGVCLLMCSFHHEKEFGPALSRGELIRDPFRAEYSLLVCQQCPGADCYFACPRRDRALCLDKKTGLKYIQTNECQGCGACREACRFSPSPIKLHPVKKKALKCDVCRDRSAGPICVEYCTGKALRLVSGREGGKE